MTKLGGLSRNFDIVQPKYHKLICETSILPSFIKILIRAQSETSILLSFIEILIKAQSETNILPSFIKILIKAQSNTSKMLCTM